MEIEELESNPEPIPAHNRVNVIVAPEVADRYIAAATLLGHEAVKIRVFDLTDEHQSSTFANRYKREQINLLYDRLSHNKDEVFDTTKESVFANVIRPAVNDGKVGVTIRHGSNHSLDSFWKRVLQLEQDS